MEVTLEQLIAQTLRQMYSECLPDDEIRNRLYQRIFGGERTGETYDEK